MSTRNRYLAMMASRRLDDSEGEGSSGNDDDDSVSVSSFDEVLQVTPPRSGVTAAAAVASTVFIPPSATARRSLRTSLSLRSNRKQGVLTKDSSAKPPTVAAKPALTVAAKPEARGPDPRDVGPCQQNKLSHFLKPAPATAGTPRVTSSPLLRRVSSQREISRKIGAQHARRNSHDASNAAGNSKGENSMDAAKMEQSLHLHSSNTDANSRNTLSHHRQVEVPLESSSASSDGYDSSSFAASVMSNVANIKSAPPVPTGTSLENRPSTRQSIRTLQRRPRYSVGGDSVKASNTTYLKKDGVQDDAPTVITEYSSSMSGHSKSFESTSSKASDSVRELDRLKRLSICGVKGRNTASDASLATSGRLEVEVKKSKSEESEITLEVSPTNSRKKELDRLKRLTRISPKDSYRKNLNSKGERWNDKGHSFSASDNETKESEGECKSNTENDEERRPVPPSPVSKRAIFRERHLTRRYDLVSGSTDEEAGERTTTSFSRRDRRSMDSLAAKAHLRATQQRQPIPSTEREKEVDPHVVPCEKQKKASMPFFPKPLVLPGEKTMTDEKNALSSKSELIGYSRTVVEVQNNSATMTRTGRQRSRSLIRSPGIETRSSTLRRSLSSPKKSPQMVTSKAASTLTSKTNRQTSLTPPRSYVRSSNTDTTYTMKSMQMTPTRTIVSDDNFAPSTPLSPLMRSSHSQLRSPKLKGFPSQQFSSQVEAKNRSLSPVLRSAVIAGAKGSQDGRELSPTRQAILRVSKPSRLVSLSIAILSKAALPIQRLVRSYLSKLALEKRKKNIVVMQSLIRRWKCRRYYKSAKTIALRCQGMYYGMVARDRLDFLHYCSVRIQAAFRGFSGFLAFIESISKIILIQSMWRMMHQRKKYVTLIEGEKRVSIAVIVCQSVTRQFLAVKHVQHLREVKCATLIQSTWRRFLASEYFIFMLSDVIVCQSVARRKIATARYNNLIAKRKMAAVSIQKTYRGCSERSMCRRLISNAITTQLIQISRESAEIKARESYSATKIRGAYVSSTKNVLAKREMAAVTIQKSYRGFSDRSIFYSVVVDVITAQSIVRRWIAMRQLPVRRQIKRALDKVAANKIRATFIGSTTWKSYLATVNCVVTCQCAARRMMAKRQVRELRQLQWAKDFVRKEAAATKIRAAYLAYITRINYLIMISNVISCQCEARKWIARKRLEEIREQRHLQWANEFVRKETAATKIRAAYLGYIARYDYFITINFVITLQCAARAMIAKNKLILQRRHAQWANEVCVAQYHNGATLIEDTWMRCRASKRELAAASIQKSYRGFRERLAFRMLIADVITTQAIVRRWSTMRQLYILRLRQTASEGDAIKAREYNAATKIRISYTSRVFLSKRKIAAVLIQKTYRGYIDRLTSRILIADVITTQAIARRWSAMRQLYILRLSQTTREGDATKVRENSAATKIRSAYLSYTSRMSYSKREMATVFIQKTYRGFSERLSYCMYIANVVTTQAIARRWSAMRQLYILRLSQTTREGDATKVRENNAATKIRSAYLSYTTRMIFLKREMATVFIQKTYRGFSERLSYCMYIANVITTQAIARRWNAMRQLYLLRLIQRATEDSAATKIRAAYTGYTARISFLLTMKSVITCQSAIRAAAARKQLLISKDAATKIQSAYRGCCARMDYIVTINCVMACQAAVRKRFAKKNLLNVKAATRIQSCWRSYKTQTDYACLICGVISFQAKIRQHLAKIELTRRSMHWQEVNQCATRIQACWRTYTARGDFDNVIWAVLSIQTNFRCYLMVCKYKQELARRASAAVIIQSAIRTYTCYTEYTSQQVSAIVIQASFRMLVAVKKRRQLSAMYRAESILNLEKGGVLAIQDRWRQFLNRRRISEDMIVSERIIFENRAATAIQSCFRGYRDFLDYALKTVAVVLIQGCVRRYISQCTLNRLKVRNLKKVQQEYAILHNSAATAIQSCFRGYREFMRYLMISFSAIRVEACVRGYFVRCNLRRLKRETLEHAAATAIQSCFRGFREFVKFVIDQYFIIKIQTLARSYLARCQYKQLKKDDREKMQNERETKAAMVIQHFFIKIKAEIEIEITRMKQTRVMKKKSREGGDRTGRHNKPAARIVNSSIDPSSFNVKGSYNLSSVSGGQSRRFFHNDEQDFHNVRNASPSTERMPSIQAANSTGNVRSNAYQMNNGTPKKIANLSIDTNHQHAVSCGQTRRYAHNLGQDMYTMRNLSSSGEHLSSVHSAQSTGNENSKAYQMSNVTPRIVAEQNMGRNHQNALSQASPSKERIILTSQMYLGQFRTQNAGQDRHHAGWRAPSRDDSSPPNKRMPSIQSIVQQDVYGPYASFNQAMHAPSPSYGNTHPFHHPPFNHNPSLQHPPNFQALHGAHNSQPEPLQWHNPPIQHSHHLTTNLMPRSNSHHQIGLLNTSHHPQHQRNINPSSSSHQSATATVKSHYPEHQRHSVQIQSPAQSDQYNNRQYHQNARY